MSYGKKFLLVKLSEGDKLLLDRGLPQEVVKEKLTAEHKQAQEDYQQRLQAGQQHQGLPQVEGNITLVSNEEPLSTATDTNVKANSIDSENASTIDAAVVLPQNRYSMWCPRKLTVGVIAAASVAAIGVVSGLYTDTDDKIKCKIM